MQNPDITWLVTFGIIAYWVVLPLVDLIRTPKTEANINRSATRAAYQ